MLARLDLRRLALAVAALIALLGALGVEHALARHGGPWVRMPVFGLDNEGSVPAVFSGLLLLGAALASREARAVHAAALTGLGAVFAFMAVDEVLAVHEHLESVVGEQWQVVYLPLMAVAGGLWLVVLRELRGRAQALFVGGAAAWVVAQLIEHFQRDGAVLVHRWTILPEELLEMTGSALFMFALLVAAREDVPASLRARAAVSVS